MDDPTQYLRFAAALVFVLALMGAVLYALRAFGFVSLAPRRPTDRRLSIAESLLLDARRRLVLVRRDDKEHLILLSPTGETLVECGFEATPAKALPGSSPTLIAINSERQL